MGSVRVLRAEASRAQLGGSGGPSVLEGTDPLKDGLFLGSGPLFPWKTADPGQSRL